MKKTIIFNLLFITMWIDAFSMRILFLLLGRTHPHTWPKASSNSKNTTPPPSVPRLSLWTPTASTAASPPPKASLAKAWAPFSSTSSTTSRPLTSSMTRWTRGSGLTPSDTGWLMLRNSKQWQISSCISWNPPFKVCRKSWVSRLWRSLTRPNTIICCLSVYS